MTKLVTQEDITEAWWVFSLWVFILVGSVMTIGFGSGALLCHRSSSLTFGDVLLLSLIIFLALWLDRIINGTCDAYRQWRPYREGRTSLRRDYKTLQEIKTISANDFSS